QRWTLLTVEGAGEHPRRGGLTYATRPGEQKRVMHTAELDGVAQRADDVLLPHDVVERRGPVFASEYEVGHGDGLKTQMRARVDWCDAVLASVPDEPRSRVTRGPTPSAPPPR